MPFENIETQNDVFPQQGAEPYPDSVIARPVRTLAVAIRIPRPLIPDPCSVALSKHGSKTGAGTVAHWCAPLPHPDP